MPASWALASAATSAADHHGRRPRHDRRPTARHVAEPQRRPAADQDRRRADRERRRRVRGGRRERAGLHVAAQGRRHRGDEHGRHAGTGHRTRMAGRVADASAGRHRQLMATTAAPILQDAPPLRSSAPVEETLADASPFTSTSGACTSTERFPEILMPPAASSSIDAAPPAIDNSIEVGPISTLWPRRLSSEIVCSKSSIVILWPSGDLITRLVIASVGRSAGGREVMLQSPPRTYACATSPFANATSTSSPSCGIAQMPAESPATGAQIRAQGSTSGSHGSFTWTRPCPVRSMLPTTTPGDTPDSRGVASAWMSSMRSSFTMLPSGPGRQRDRVHAGGALRGRGYRAEPDLLAQLEAGPVAAGVERVPRGGDAPEAAVGLADALYPHHVAGEDPGVPDARAARREPPVQARQQLREDQPRRGGHRHRLLDEQHLLARATDREAEAGADVEAEPLAVPVVADGHRQRQLDLGPPDAPRHAGDLAHLGDPGGELDQRV